MLVRYEHRNAGEPRDQRAPDVRAELVAVQDVRSLVAKQPDERAPCGKVELAPSIELENVHACRAKLVEQVGVRRPRDAERAIEASGVEALDQLGRDSFATSSTVKTVDDSDHADRRSVRLRRKGIDGGGCYARRQGGRRVF